MPALLYQLADLQIGHWVMIAGGALAILGAIGLLISDESKHAPNASSASRSDGVKKISDEGEERRWKSGQAPPPLPVGSATNIRSFPPVRSGGKAIWWNEHARHTAAAQGTCLPCLRNFRVGCQNGDCRMLKEKSPGR